MTSPAQNVNSACQIRERCEMCDLRAFCSSQQLGTVEHLAKTLHSIRVWYVLNALLPSANQCDALELKVSIQSRQTDFIATIKCITHGDFEDRIATHWWGSVSLLQGSSTTHRSKRGVCAIGDCSIQRPNRGGEMPAQWERGARSPSSDAHLLYAPRQQGGNNTHSRQNWALLALSLTSSCCLWPSNCVGGSANRKVRVSETRGRGHKYSAGIKLILYWPVYM